MLHPQAGQLQSCEGFPCLPIICPAPTNRDRQKRGAVLASPRSPPSSCRGFGGADGAEGRQPIEGEPPPGARCPHTALPLSPRLPRPGSGRQPWLLPSSCRAQEVSSPLLSPFSVRQIRATWRARDKRQKKKKKQQTQTTNPPQMLSAFERNGDSHNRGQTGGGKRVLRASLPARGDGCSTMCFLPCSNPAASCAAARAAPPSPPRDLGTHPRARGSPRRHLRHAATHSPGTCTLFVAAGSVPSPRSASVLTSTKRVLEWDSTDTAWVREQASTAATVIISCPHTSSASPCNLRSACPELSSSTPKPSRGGGTAPMQRADRLPEAHLTSRTRAALLGELGIKLRN